MGLMFDGSERDTIIINKNVYKFDHIWVSADDQNAKYGGRNLGAFTEDYATQIKNGDFYAMQVGDTFTQNHHTYTIAGFNYLYGADHNSELQNHLIMITDHLDIYAMNPYNTTDGGFAGSNMWTSHFPDIVSQLKTDFGSHLLTWNEFLTTGTDGHAANQGAFFRTQASMMNTVMYWGTPSKFSTPSGDKNWNIGIENKQLPIMKLHPDEQKGGFHWDWQRDIYSDKAYATVNDSGAATADDANGVNSVRAFFLID